MTMTEIPLEICWEDCPSSQPTPSECRPYVEEGVLFAYSGFDDSSSGRHRGGGCRTTISMLAEDVILCEVGAWHRYGGSGQDYYVVRDVRGVWKRRTAQHRAVKSAIAGFPAFEAACQLAQAKASRYEMGQFFADAEDAVNQDAFARLLPAMASASLDRAVIVRFDIIEEEESHA